MEKALHTALQTNTGSLLWILEYTVGIRNFPLATPHSLIRTQRTVGTLWTVMKMQQWYFQFWKLLLIVREKGCKEGTPVLGDDMLTWQIGLKRIGVVRQRWVVILQFPFFFLRYGGGYVSNFNNIVPTNMLKMSLTLNSYHLQCNNK